MSEIKTKSVGLGVAKSTPVFLDGTPETKIQFNPTLHGKGVSGNIVKFRKDRKTPWKGLKQGDFKNHALAPMEKIELPVSTEALKKLIVEVQSREEIVKDGIKYGSHDYIVVEKDKAVLLDDKNKKSIIDQLLAKGYSSEFWDILSQKDPNLADKIIFGHLQVQRQKVIEELKSRLLSTFPETRGSDSWQSWIYRNHWLFGASYQTPIEKQKINITGIMPDFLFPTLDDFVDILEIKLPSDTVIIEDGHRPGAWAWTPEANKAIGQVVNYLCEIDRLRLEIEKAIEIQYLRKVSLIKPRAYVLIGESKLWLPSKKDGLRKLNNSLHGIEVLTYSDLVSRGETFLNAPSAPIETTSEIDNIPF